MVNKATFIVVETIMVLIKNSIKLINTTSLSDNNVIEQSGNTYLLQCAFPMFKSISYYLAKINKKKQIFVK